MISPGVFGSLFALFPVRDPERPDTDCADDRFLLAVLHDPAT